MTQIAHYPEETDLIEKLSKHFVADQIVWMRQWVWKLAERHLHEHLEAIAGGKVLPGSLAVDISKHLRSIVRVGAVEVAQAPPPRRHPMDLSPGDIYEESAWQAAWRERDKQIAELRDRISKLETAPPPWMVKDVETASVAVGCEPMDAAPLVPKTAEIRNAPKQWGEAIAEASRANDARIADWQARVAARAANPAIIVGVSGPSRVATPEEEALYGVVATPNPVFSLADAAWRSAWQERRGHVDSAELAFALGFEEGRLIEHREREASDQDRERQAYLILDLEAEKKKLTGEVENLRNQVATAIAERDAKVYDVDKGHEQQLQALRSQLREHEETMHGLVSFVANHLHPETEWSRDYVTRQWGRLVEAPKSMTSPAGIVWSALIELRTLRDKLRELTP